MNEEKEIPINLMIDAVFNNFNDDTELMARWLFKNGYINKNKDGNYIINKKYKPTFFTTKEIKEYDYAFRYLQQENENLRTTIKNDDVAVNNLCKEIENLKQQLKDKDEKISEIIEYIKENIKAELLNGSIWIDKCKLLNILESNKED
jgi:predicted RNase H-like nuclease (RuvC/YqgF family)